MKRFALLWIALAGFALLVSACSDQNSPDNQAHPEGWVLAHGSDAGASGNADDCRTCHGASLGGGGVGVACRDCHVDGPPFHIHPSSWGDALFAHMSFPESFSWTTCGTAACHGTDLHGGHGSGETGPSCFTDDFTNRDGRNTGCHGIDGPTPPESHQGVTFSDPALHGPLAKGQQDTQNPGQLDPASGQLYCRNCHGVPPNDFSGGFVTDSNYPGRRACSSTTCHPDAGAHPGDWLPGGGSSRHASAPEAAWVVGCGLCHEVPGKRGPSPLAGAPSCFAENFDGASCHGTDGPGGAPHPLNAAWLVSSSDVGTSHVAASLDDATDCLTCHVDLQIPPDCTECHTAGDPLDAANRPCISCHAEPPTDPSTAVATRPNREGAHGEHVDLTGDTADCSACHNGAGTGTTNHWDTSPPATVAILGPTYEGKRGTATYTFDATSSTGTCADVSCHGGQTTPEWLTGALDVNQDCDQCHELGTGAGVPEANSYHSGLHGFHTSFAPCTACHDTGLLAAQHLTGLDTPEFEGVPAASLRTDLGYAVPAQTCTTSITGCHAGQLRGWGGAPHPVDAAWLLPSGTATTSHVLASIQDSTSCIGCHTLTGGGQDPACGTCHNAPSAIHFAVGQCDSCHNQPPDAGTPVGNERPNRPGAHGGHVALTADTADCAACHQGAGTDTLQHFDADPPATVVILTATYQGKRGTAAYTFDAGSGTGTCANINCHGGQTTPTWIGGALTVDQDCAQCHELGTAAQTPENNSFYSGRHSTHVGYASLFSFSPPCDACHDPAKLESGGHFVGLNTPSFEGVPADTMRDQLSYAAPDCTNSTTDAAYGSCHPGQTRSWEGGAAHIVGQQWLLPTEHASAYINNPSSCLVSGCHTVDLGAGTGGPACRACHTASAPQGDTAVCTSCHARPPNGTTQPNRAGRHQIPQHSFFINTCTFCHNAPGSGSGGPQHFDRVGDQGVAPNYPAEVVFSGANINYAPATSTCSGTGLCHGSETWY